MTAVISDDGVYRYVLTRDLGSLLDTEPKTVVFIMLNPSTADASKDDPTIRRCKRFARDWGCSRLVVVNLFAYRATDPTELRRVDDPIGKDNLIHILREASAADMVICAWGDVGPLHNQAFAVMKWLTARRVELHCLGRTQKGYPRHPLYVPKDRQPATYP